MEVRVYVGNLNKATTQDQINTLFATAGTVSSVDLVMDANIIGITPDYVVKVRDDILIEIDGPMLKHGLQSLDNNKIGLPHQRSNWPDRGRLEMRYARFLFASA
jgi:hypothetical protein